MQLMAHLVSGFAQYLENPNEKRWPWKTLNSPYILLLSCINP